MCWRTYAERLPVHADYVPDHDSEIVRRHKAAGLVILGKTNTPEYGLVPVAESQCYGPANNPWDLTRTTGGSSGGSATAVVSAAVEHWSRDPTSGFRATTAPKGPGHAGRLPLEQVQA